MKPQNVIACVSLALISTLVSASDKGAADNPFLSDLNELHQRYMKEGHSASKFPELHKWVIFSGIVLARDNNDSYIFNLKVGTQENKKELAELEFDEDDYVEFPNKYKKLENLQTGVSLKARCVLRLRDKSEYLRFEDCELWDYNGKPLR